MSHPILPSILAPILLGGTVVLALGGTASAGMALSAPQDDATTDEVRPPSRDLRAGEDENKRYFLIGAEEDAKAPKGGWKLVLVMPGGDGSADFQRFVERIWENALGEGYLVAELVAPKWTDDQFDNIVWPTKKNPWRKAKFTTEAFLEAVIEDVEERHEIDPEHVFTLSWSSGGPAAYAYSLTPRTRVTGSFVAMSVFKPDTLPSLKAAKGQAYYVLHSPQDFIPIKMAEDAKEKLSKAKAKVELATYSGGHGWKGDVYGNLRAGFEWLEKNHAEPSKKKR